MKRLIKGGEVVFSDRTEVCDLLIEDGKIVKIAKNIAPDGDTDVIDASNKTVFPGIIDMHVHLR